MKRRSRAPATTPTINGSDCVDALAWTNEDQTFMQNVNRLIFIIGTNNTHRVGADETVRCISQTVESVRYLYPDLNIIWQLLQKRSSKTWLLPEGQPVLNEISRCNIQLTQLAAEMKFNTIQPDIPIEYMCDGLHPSAHGVRMMETNIRHYLKENKTIYSSSFSHVPSLSHIAVSSILGLFGRWVELWKF
ncbi:unnamed protein product [Didymodactylos carnosus]|uniref:SGNH hydrolase-type esterase domain-containing protein n=1 Tax=Didymodactylos carnosus TaxID=1234261 RepID=A0A815G579_9BILA|nr:unnamed protein product [Didymodactylos carnosus]CAF1334588.1 unnamed protein product [Didymodactylos carnosus]CAF3807100.1 unnamed protein product [Didymodactylos carnosus]CAF4190892.1 unnamed protein product [Didymodactylos carnosus]